MERTACVDIRALPLQLLLQRHPDWKGHPVVVVDQDKPQGIILWVSARAREHAVLPGMRYAAALSLTQSLRGGVVTEPEITATVEELTQTLWHFSPRIEPVANEPGVFWLDASGLQHLYDSLDHWRAQLCRHLQAEDFQAIVAVGFSRFGSYAAAKSAKRSQVFAHPAEEQAFLREVPLSRLLQEPRTNARLHKLGIHSLGDFLALPAAGIRRRFGPEAAALYQHAHGDSWSPMNPLRLYEAITRSEVLDYPETNTDRLFFRIAAMSAPLFEELAARNEALKGLHLELLLEDRSRHDEEIQPATPTLESKPVLLLLRLRLETLALSAGVNTVTLRVDSTPLCEDQLELLHDTPQRTLEAAQRAFAAVRAELGNDAVRIALLSEGHLPEGQYTIAPLKDLASPLPRKTAGHPLVRRIYQPPRMLPQRERHEPDGWLVAGVAEGPVEEVIGPQVIAGGWWAKALERRYYYVRTRSGRWLWIYYDRGRRRWYLHGEVQ